MSVRLIKAPISISFEPLGDKDYQREYDILSGVDNDPVGQWFNRQKTKANIDESEKLLFELLINLHRKVDNLENLIKNNNLDRLKLLYNANIDEIGFEHFKFKESLLEKNLKYYGRIDMPIYPRREIGVFFIALDDKLASISKMDERDLSDWNSYLTARERIMIRNLKKKKEEND